MPEGFSLEFDYKGAVEKMDCTLRVSSYGYQILCSAENVTLIIERDDEGNLRAREADPFSKNTKKMSTGYIQAMMKELDRILQ